MTSETMRFGMDDEMATGTTRPSIPEGRERRRLETKSRQYLLMLAPQTSAEDIEISAPVDVTPELFEYDIAGPRVRAMGQTTGGFTQEVAENEAAFSFALQDPVALYLLKRIAENHDLVDQSELDSIIGNAKGWMRLAALIKGGLVEVIGTHVKATERGLTELTAISSYCDLKGT